MATSEDFYHPRNTRLCILYEYLRGQTPKKALIEFEKAKKGHVDLETITKWFARFTNKKYDVDINGCDSYDARKDDPSAVGDDEEAINLTLKQLKEKNEIETLKNKKFNDDNLLEFFKDLEDSFREEAIVTEVEISHKNQSQPNHVLIAVRYTGNTGTQKTIVLELYHCSNGAVVRREKETKLLEGDDYTYKNLATMASLKLLSMFSGHSKNFKDGLLKVVAEETTDEFFSVLLENLKIMSDAPGGILASLIDGHVDFHTTFRPSQSFFSADLIMLGEYVNGLTKLEINYNKTLDKCPVNYLKEAIDKFARDDSSGLVSCVIHNQITTNELVNEMKATLNVPADEAENLHSQTVVEVEKDNITIKKKMKSEPSDQSEASRQ